MGKERQKTRLVRLAEERARMESRRRFLKFAGATLGVVMTGGGVVALTRLEGQRRIEEAERAFRKDVVLPRFELTNPQELTGGGWLEPIELGPEMAVQTPEAITNFYLNSVTERMQETTFAPFVQTADTITKHAYGGGTPKNGEIRLDAQQFNPETEGASIFKTTVHINPNQTWHELLLANAVWMDPRNRYATDPQISQLWIPVNTALGMVHEILGHYRLNEQLIPFYQSLGLGLKESVNQVIRYFGQEPFAYAVQSEAMRPLMVLPGIENVLLSSHLNIAGEWERYRDLEGNWYHPGWINFIDSL